MRKNSANMLLIGMIWGLILWASPGILLVGA